MKSSCGFEVALCTRTLSPSCSVASAKCGAFAHWRSQMLSPPAVRWWDFTSTVFLWALIAENAVNTGPDENQGLLSVRITCQPAVSPLPERKLPRDHGPFLEMLLNHHNPPQSVCVQSITGQRPSITFLAAASPGAKLCSRAVPGWDAYTGFEMTRPPHPTPPIQNFKVERVCFTLSWPRYHTSKHYTVECCTYLESITKQ